MRWAFFIVIAVHGLVHLLGFAKAFGLAELPGLAQPVSNAMGVAWLAAAVAMLSAAALFLLSPRLWWIAGGAAVLLSQIVIVSAWSDAKFGTVANAIVLAGIVYAFASQGPPSFRAEYRRAVEARLQQPVSPPLVTEADLAALPHLVQRYLRVTGAVGQPRVHHVRARWRGRIRASRNAAWMPFTAVQHNFLDEPARFFLMEARRAGVPVDVLHIFRHESATMRVRLLSLVPLVSARGADLDRAETVTLFNDLCLLAPAGLVDPAIAWEPLDPRSVRARYTAGANTISAVLTFNDAGELVDFVSDDRSMASPDGAAFTRLRWSTPASGYRRFGSRRALSRGEGRWHPPDGEFAYLELELLDLEVNARGSPVLARSLHRP